MDSDRFDRLRSIVLQALEVPAAEQEACLNRLCAGDSALRREARSLLAAEGRAPDLVRTSGAHAGLVSTEVLPETIGPYRILGVLGQGGMGTVYHAKQAEPIPRDVALKVIRAGQESADLLQRFELERRALASMHHPSIAQVYDAGTTAEGIPFFAMEYVSGKPITDYCAEHDLELSARLELFTRVCDGVGHAHRKGFIHRDIKPSNILIEEVEGQPVPKIIDFGIARATDQALSDRTRQTSLGQLIGTLEYMSPEQAAGDGRDVDTRTDVYSLGVVLYELMTGEHPLPRMSLEKGGLEDILREIREHEPKRPSSRTSRHLHQELDWIALRALEKDRERRYGSVSELAEDLRRYRKHEPVMAGPPGGAYRVKKFARRHRLPVAFGVVLAGVLLAAVVGVAWQWRAAVALGEKAQLEADRTARINEFLQGLLASARPTERGIDVTVREILNDAVEQLDEELRDAPEVQAAARHTLGKTYYALGDFPRAEEQLQKALESRIATGGEDSLDVAQNLDDLAEVHWRRQDFARALEPVQRALAIRERILPENSPEIATSLHNVAAVLGPLGRKAESSEFAQRALEIRRKAYGNDHPEVASSLNNIAMDLLKQKRHAEAEPLAREAADIRRRLLGMNDPATHHAISNLAVLLWQTGDPAAAEALYREVLEAQRQSLGDDHPDVAMVLYNLGRATEGQGRLDDAENCYRDSMRIRETRFGPVHAKSWFSRLRLARVLEKQEKIEEAIGLYEDFLDSESSSESPAPHHLVLAAALLGQDLLALGHLDEAEARLLHAAGTARSRSIGGNPRQELEKALGGLSARLGRPERLESVLSELSPPAESPR